MNPPDGLCPCLFVFGFRLTRQPPITPPTIHLLEELTSALARMLEPYPKPSPAPRRPTYTRIVSSGWPPLSRSRMTSLRWRGWKSSVSTPRCHTSMVAATHLLRVNSSCDCKILQIVHTRYVHSRLEQQVKSTFT